MFPPDHMEIPGYQVHKEHNCVSYYSEDAAATALDKLPEPAFCDYGERIGIPQESLNEVNVLAALKLAAAKWGRAPVVFTGPPEFRITCARLAARYDLVVVGDADLQMIADQAKRAAAKDAAQTARREDIQDAIGTGLDQEDQDQSLAQAREKASQDALDRIRRGWFGGRPTEDFGVEPSAAPAP